MRGKRLLAEYITDMSYGTYRNCLSRLVQNDLLIKIEHGGGRTAHGRGTATRYLVNSPAVHNSQPPQGVLPEIARSPDTQPPKPESSNDTLDSSAIDLYERIEGLLAAGITAEQIHAIIDVVEATLTGSQDLPEQQRNMSRPDEETRHDPEKHVMHDDRFERNTSRTMTGFSEETRHDPEKHVTDNDKIQRNPSRSVTSPQYMRTKGHEEKEGHAAADESNMSRDRTGFFETLSATLAQSGYTGIRTAQFDDLSELLAEYEKQTGSPPDERTAEYIVGRLRDSPGVRNVVGFVRSVTSDVLRTGEGFVSSVASVPSTPSTAREPPPPEPETPDWELLHLAHGKQVAPAQQVWASALENLRPQVSRPAFETWLAESRGEAYIEGKFVVATPNRFIAEMLGHRLHPLVERAVRDVTGEVLSIEYAVETQSDETCPVCEGAGDVSAAVS